MLIVIKQNMFKLKINFYIHNDGHKQCKPYICFNIFSFKNTYLFYIFVLGPWTKFIQAQLSNYYLIDKAPVSSTIYLMRREMMMHR